MRTASSASFLLLALLVAACGGGKGPATLVVKGSGFTEGRKVRLALVDVASNRIDQTPSPIIVIGGAIQFTLPVTSDTTYRVDLYADDDGDGLCQWGFDEVHAVDVSLAERETRAVSITPGVTDDSRGCLSFGASSLRVTASNIQTNPTTATFWGAALVRCPQGDTRCDIGSGQRVDLQNGALVGGTIRLVFDGGIVPEYVYRVDLFINEMVDLKVTCNSTAELMSNKSVLLPGPQTDGLTGTTIDLAINAVSNEASDAICASFPTN